MNGQIDTVKKIADGMIGIGGVPTNEEFYAEFDARVRAALNINKSDLICGAPKEFLPCNVNDCGKCKLPTNSDYQLSATLKHTRYQHPTIELCRHCKGEGTVYELHTDDMLDQYPILETCATCNGSGRVKISKVITINVEPFK